MRPSWPNPFLVATGVNPHSIRPSTQLLLLALLFALSSLSARAHAFTVDARAARFVADIVLNDFHTAQAGGGYVVTYDRDETDATLLARLERWFSGTDPQAITMEPAGTGGKAPAVRLLLGG